MKNTLNELVKKMIFVIAVLFCNLASAENITIRSADTYPYNNLLERTDDIKVIYVTDDKNLTCRVEVVLDKMKWTSAANIISKKNDNDNLLANCLPEEKAEQILLQTFLQFGQGL